MFFIMGISQGKKKLGFDQTVVCPHCGKYGHLEVYMLYSCLSLFFIPILKWGRSYIVHTTCCGQTVPIDPELGRKIEKGQLSSLPEDIIPAACQPFPAGKRCSHCGFETGEDFRFCPKCVKEFL